MAVAYIQYRTLTPNSQAGLKLKERMHIILPKTAAEKVPLTRDRELSYTSCA